MITIRSNKIRIRDAFSVMPRSDRPRILIVVFLQILLGSLDLVGVALIGMIGALAIRGVESKSPGNRVEQILRLLHIDKFTFQGQTAILAISAGIILIGRTLISVYLTKRILRFLSNRSAQASHKIMSDVLSQSLLFIQSKTLQETLYVVTTGMTTLMVSVIGSTITMVSDVSLLLVIAIGLVLVDPTIALGTFILFGSVAAIIYRTSNRRIQLLGQKEGILAVASNEMIVESLTAYREALVRNRLFSYAEKIGGLRSEYSGILAKMAFMPSISKYVIETAIVLGALLMSAAQFLLQDASHAVGTLAVFLAAGTRIAPALLRIQQGQIIIRGGLGSSTKTLEYLADLRSKAPLKDSPLVKISQADSAFIPSIEVRELNFNYAQDANESNTISSLSLKIRPGTQVAFVGTSGAGKTTLIDLMIGAFDPLSGTILINGESPRLAVKKWPGKIGYVPQEVAIFNGTIRENIALGFSPDSYTYEEVWDAVETAQIADFVNGLPEGLETKVGDRGTSLSGGQRQRLGIARALFTRPSLLFMDEATSALDGDTEAKISEAIQNLKGSTTLVIVAHRLSSIKNSDEIFYLENGTIRASGSFDYLRKTVPEFDSQAIQLGM